MVFITTGNIFWVHILFVVLFGLNHVVQFLDVLIPFPMIRLAQFNFRLFAFENLLLKGSLWVY